MKPLSEMTEEEVINLDLGKFKEELDEQYRRDDEISHGIPVIVWGWIMMVIGLGGALLLSFIMS